MRHTLWCRFVTRHAEWRWVRRLSGSVWEKWKTGGESRIWSGLILWIEWDSRVCRVPFTGEFIAREDWREKKPKQVAISTPSARDTHMRDQHGD